MYVLFQINDLIFTFTLITVYFIFLSYLVFHLGYLCHFTCIFLFFSSSQFLPNQIREGKSFNFISFHLFSIKQIKINSIFTFFFYIFYSLALFPLTFFRKPNTALNYLTMERRNFSGF